MILTHLNDASRYEGLNPLFPRLFEYLRSCDLSTLPTGKELLEGEDLIVMVNDATLKAPEQAKMEVHDVYIDVHVPLSGPERFSWKDRGCLTTPSEPFDRVNDGQHYDDAPTAMVDVLPGEILILFPEDAHAACIGEAGTAHRKIVVKVKA